MNRQLEPQHLKHLLLLAVASIAIALPLNLQAWVFISKLKDMDIVFTAQAASLSSLLLLTLTILAPLFMRQPWEQRLKGFVLFWFAAAILFNLVWELPLVIFKEEFAALPITRENLSWAIGWWGYGFADHHYGQATPFMVVMEIWFLFANAFAAVAFFKLRSAPKLAWMLFGIAGALQAYNVLLYATLIGMVDSLSFNEPPTAISMALYWGYNQLWGLTGAAAGFVAFRQVLRT